jgi:hypothetical protein
MSVGFIHSSYRFTAMLSRDKSWDPAAFATAAILCLF